MLRSNCLAGSLPNQQENLVRRVEKLLALSQSNNQNEAAAAMAKADELITKFNLPRLKGKEPSDYISTLLGNPALRHFREESHLAFLLERFYFVKTIWVESFVLNKGKTGRALEISGTRSNIEIATYIYDGVNNFIDRQWKDFCKGKRAGRYRKSDFAVGIIDGFRGKLESERSQLAERFDDKSLIVIKDPYLDDYMSDRYPHMVRKKASAAKIDPEFYHQEIAKGKELSLRKGVASNAPKAKTVKQIA